MRGVEVDPIYPAHQRGAMPLTIAASESDYGVPVLDEWVYFVGWWGSFVSVMLALCSHEGKSMEIAVKYVEHVKRGHLGKV